MDKRLLLLGIVLIIIGIAVAVSYSSSNLSNIATTTKEAVAIAPNSIIYSPIAINVTNLVYIVYASGKEPLDFYLVNSSAFISVQPYLKSGIIPANLLSSLEGRGLYMEVENSTEGIFPYNSSLNGQGFSSPAYYNNTLLSKGTYYMIYRNPGNVTANATYGYVLPNGALINSTTQLSSSGLGLEGGASALLLLAGIVLVIYSFISAGRPTQSAKQRDEAIQKLYADIEKKERMKDAKRKSQRKRH